MLERKPKPVHSPMSTSDEGLAHTGRWLRMHALCRHPLPAYTCVALAPTSGMPPRRPCQPYSNGRRMISSLPSTQAPPEAGACAAHARSSRGNLSSRLSGGA